jgi:phosphoribosylaminoimidazolecarboxamide formyltransferase/IMP cyclohydrolase
MSEPDIVRTRRALVSVSDKTGIIDLARALVAAGAEIVSTGGTASHLRGAGVPVTSLDDVTGFPEILGGRVKTLHPAVHAGVLARDRADDAQDLLRHRIQAIDLVAVSLYPFERAAAAGAQMDEAVEEIDIGGIALLRAAAKNWKRVIVVADPGQYPAVIDAISRGGVGAGLRLQLAAEAFARVAAYDAAIAGYFQRESNDGPFPSRVTLSFEKQTDLRYGENPHQRAALYALAGGPPKGAPRGDVISASVLGGKALSFNNIADLEAAWRLVVDLPRPAVAIIKHMNPCGAAIGRDLREAFERARAGDPVAAFGGIIASNAAVDVAAATAMSELFVEAIIAPSFEPDALTLFRTKKNLRVLEAGNPTASPTVPVVQDLETKWVKGGLLIQDPDAVARDESAWSVVTERAPSVQEWQDLRFAWVVCAHVKSNAIVFAKDGQVVGVGAGQMSRVDSVRLAAQKAGERARGAVAASDAFFPFADGVESAADAGVTAVIQPGGSMRDAEVVAAANRRSIAMAVTGERHFRH